MTGRHKREFPLFIIGDLISLVISLVITLIIRTGNWPSLEVFYTHFLPFSYLFVAFICIAFIAGLYEKHTLFIKGRIPQLLINVQIAHAIFAIALFYFIPYFSITPKIILFIYLVVSLGFLVLWRIVIAPRLTSRKPDRAVMIGKGTEAHDLELEINNNHRYGVSIADIIDPALGAEAVISKINATAAYDANLVVIIDMHDPVIAQILPQLYELVFKGIRFVDVSTLYEDIFDREPISLLDQAWFIENISMSPKVFYDIGKQCLDVLVSVIVGIISLILYPFVILAIKIEDRGSAFIRQPRIGQNGRIIQIIKFRTMTHNDNGTWANGSATENQVTRVGAFLRKSRIDELPQLWNVLKGDISLIGPRPELPEPVAEYSKAIPYYNVRHIVKPGLSGWAQIYHDEHPHHGLDIIETRNKLSYDLYYIKHRSFLLDLKIALRTIQVLVTFVGR